MLTARESCRLGRKARVGQPYEEFRDGNLTRGKIYATVSIPFLFYVPLIAAGPFADPEQTQAAWQLDIGWDLGGESKQQLKSSWWQLFSELFHLHVEVEASTRCPL